MLANIPNPNAELSHQEEVPFSGDTGDIALR